MKTSNRVIPKLQDSVNGEVLDQKKIDRLEFKNLIIENIVIISRWDIEDPSQ